jgi:Universal stress protein family
MYRYQQTSRTFLIGLDNKDYSQYALEWGMKELFEDSDEIVILRVIDSGILLYFLESFSYTQRKKHYLKQMVPERKRHIKSKRNGC